MNIEVAARQLQKGKMPFMPVRSDVATTTWTFYRRVTPLPWRPTAVARPKWFARTLATAWTSIRQQATDAAKTVDRNHTGRIASLRLEMPRIDTRPFEMLVARDRAVLTEEIRCLATKTLASAARMAA